MPNRLALALVLVLAACSGTVDSGPMVAEPPITTTGSSTTTTSAAPSTTTTTDLPMTTAVEDHLPPPWLGTRPLPLRPDGHGRATPTPPELVDRRIRTEDLLAPPLGDLFESSIATVPAAVAARSTWTPECPIRLEELAYVTVAHWGFDGRAHTGELLIRAEHAEDVVEVFERLFDARFPIEQMRVTGADELDAPPTGDQNVTGAFVCRRVVGGSGSWSMHAVGEAIDINPFHNPYVRGDLVIPELASAYADRDRIRPGMIVEGDVVVQAFDEIGWRWGGRWSGLTDPMHFSTTGR
jgi:hypothetical protein